MDKGGKGTTEGKETKEDKKRRMIGRKNDNGCEDDMVYFATSSYISAKNVTGIISFMIE